MNKPCFEPDFLAAVSWPELAANAHYKAALLAKKLDVSQRTLERFFRKRLQTSPQKYLEKLRQSVAETLVARGMRTKEVAILLEYKQSSHFCRLFKQQHRGIAPRAWRATPKVSSVAILNEIQPMGITHQSRQIYDNFNR